MLREDADRERRPAMKEAAMSLSREGAVNAELRSSARRTGCAGARREPCLTERRVGSEPGNMIYTIKERTYPRMQEKRRLPGRATTWRVRIAPPRRVLDRPIVRVLGVHNDGGVSRYQA